MTDTLDFIFIWRSPAFWCSLIIFGMLICFYCLARRGNIALTLKTLLLLSFFLFTTLIVFILFPDDMVYFFFLFFIALVPIFLYFYNLIHDQSHYLKNFLLRVGLVTSIPVSYTFLGYGVSLLVFIFSLPFLLFFSLFCLITNTKILNRYFYHLCGICLYCLIVLVLSLYPDKVTSFFRPMFSLFDPDESNETFRQFWSYMSIVPCMIFFGLVIYGILDLMFCLKSWLTGAKRKPAITAHNLICLLYCFVVMVITGLLVYKTPFTMFLQFYAMGDATVFYYLFFGLFIVPCVAIPIFIHHFICFFKLFLSWKESAQKPKMEK